MDQDIKTKADTSRPRQILTIVKFRGQKEATAGIAFPNLSRVMSLDEILVHGIYFNNLNEFCESVKNDKHLQLFIVNEAMFNSLKIDKTLFQAFECKEINDK